MVVSPEEVHGYMRKLKTDPLDVEALRDYIRGRQELVADGKVRADSPPLLGGLDRATLETSVGKAVEAFYKDPYNLTPLWHVGAKARDASKSGGNGRALRVAIFSFRSIYDVAELAPNLRATAAIELARLHYGLKEYPEAKKFLDSLKGVKNVAKLPKDIQDYMAEIDAQITAQTYANAQSSQELATPESRVLAQAPGAERDAKISALEKTVEEGGDREKVLKAALELSRHYLGNRNYNGALRVLDKGVKLHPDNYELMKRIAEAHVGKVQNEVSELEGRMDADIEEARVRKVDLAVSLYSELAIRQPNDFEVRLVLGENLLAQGERVRDREIIIKAVEHLQVDYSKEGDTKRAAVLLGRAFLSLDLPLAAIGHYSHLITALRDPDGGVKGGNLEPYLDAESNLSIALERAGRFQEAHDALLRVLQRRIKFPCGLERLQEIEAKLRQST